MWQSTAKVRYANMGTNNRYSTRIIPRDKLTGEQIKILDNNASGILIIENGHNFGSQTENAEHVSTSSQTEEVDSDAMRTLGMIVSQMTTVEVVKPKGTRQERVHQILQNVIKQLENLKRQMGTFARNTIFSNVGKLASAMFGIGESSVMAIKGKFRPAAKEQHRSRTSKSRNAAALQLLSDEDRKIIDDHIAKCHEDDANFTIASLHEDLVNMYGYPYGPTTLYRQLRAMRLSYKKKAFNPLATIRKDLIEWRSKYLGLMEKLRMEGAFVCYYDETWLFHGMSKIRGWNRTDTNPYLIACMGDLSKPRPGFPAASDKGQRAIVLAVVTESEILEGSIDVVISNRPDSEILVDYHSCMNSEMYESYMEKVLPMIVSATPAGRQPILVIDNAVIHNTLVEKIPTKSSTKQQLLDFLSKRGYSLDVRFTKDELWNEVNHYIQLNGGRKSIQKYKVDEMAAALGVRVVRLPPYHCQFSPIELVWNQLKSHLKKVGKTTDKLEVVRERAIDYLKNKSESDIAWTYEHIRDIEEGIKLVMDRDDLSDDSDDSDDSDTD